MRQAGGGVSQKKSKPGQNHVSAECGLLHHWRREGDESPVLVVVDTETGTVVAHVCKRKRADPDIEALMENIEVLGQRHRVQERPSEPSEGDLRVWHEDHI